MFTNIIVRHPYYVLTAVAVFSITCLVLPLTLKKLPNFSDPQVGFETRGTPIAKRLTAWSNLVDATKPSGMFAVDPRDWFISTTTPSIYKQIKDIQKIKRKNEKKKNKNKNKNKVLIPGSQDYTIVRETNVSENSVRNYWKELKELSESGGFRRNADGFFCGMPDHRYSRVVVASTDGGNLFTHKSMLEICRIERQLIQNPHFSSLCDTIKKHHCCAPWSVVNYIALLHNRTSCLNITEEDVTATLVLLETCSPFYHNLKLTRECLHNCESPIECNRHDAVFNILHYLTDTEFLPANVTRNFTGARLQQTMIFLPIGCSTKTLEYYHYLERKILGGETIKVVAMEFGLKNALFDELLLRDTRLIGAGLLFIILCMWFYTESLFLTIMTIIGIVFSLGISYFTYTLVFEIDFFPFMNILATVVVIGIGADDVFIFCKYWHVCKIEKNGSVMQLMRLTFQHAVVTMFVTSLTTAAAFFSSLISSVTAICCFGVFAGVTIIANFFIMFTWFPACMVIAEHSCWNSYFLLKWTKFRNFRIGLERFWKTMETFLLHVTLKFRYFWIVSLSVVSILCMVIVVKYPGMRLPESVDFQLLHSSHPFEQYDFIYKQKFWYEQHKLPLDLLHTEHVKLPLRFVWGILPEDNGNYLNPYAKGTLQLDSTFDMADPQSQKWLLNFCRDLRSQPFYLPTPGPLLPNCFIETFFDWMQRRCVDPIANIDRSPCCEAQPFPFERNIFELCIQRALSSLYNTPTEYFLPGVAGPKFFRDVDVPMVKAVVVEYDSTYTHSRSFNYLKEFFDQVENWMQEQLKNAPIGMRKGWFVSDLDYYDLQKVLSESTLNALTSSVVIAFVVAVLVTLNLLISVYAIITITSSIFTSMGILILAGWRLNVVESLAVSTAVGLAVDYSMHYGVSYKLCRDNTNRNACARQCISNMGGSTAMAALTTGAAGAFMIPSTVLAYIQIGVFLVVIMFVSWLYSTFMFTAMLSVMGPERNFGQFSYPFLKGCISVQTASCDPDEVHTEQEESSFHTQTRPRTNLLSETTLSTTSTIYATPASESHELDSLTDKSTGYDLKQQETQRPIQNYSTTDQSPSAVSNVTVVMTDDN